MFRTLSIENFRAFRKFHLTGLGRVNLLVGSNNSGKTSVLEALEFLALGGDIRALVRSLSRRAERALPMHDDDSPESWLDTRCLFHQRDLDGSTVRLLGERAGAEPTTLTVSARPVDISTEQQAAEWVRTMAMLRRRRSMTRAKRNFEENELALATGVPRFLEVQSGEEVVASVPLTLHGLLLDESEFITGTNKPQMAVRFIDTSSKTQSSLADLLDQVVLTDNEETVVRALNSVEDIIVKIAAVGGGFRDRRRIVVGLRGVSDPVPLGSLGEGMSRMLAIALALVAARDGYLLIDEIDTGLHHTVIRKMWRLVFDTAVRLNVCVCATTHSYDCVHALAAIANPDQDGEVSLIRVDRERSEGVHFNEKEIALLAEREIEPR